MEKQKRVIRVTEEQLREAYPGIDQYLGGSSDVKPFDGNCDISVTGKVSADKDGQPLTTDDIAAMRTNQNSPYGSRHGGGVRPYLHEADNNSDGVDDFYNHEEMDTLSNGDEDDNLTRIPEGVTRKLDILVDAINTLNGKQKAIVLNKLVESIDMAQVPSQWRKELSLKILAGKNGAEQIH